MCGDGVSIERSWMLGPDNFNYPWHFPLIGSQVANVKYEGFVTFNVKKEGGALTVTFEYSPVNVRGQAMLGDLTSLAMRLEPDRANKGRRISVGTS